MFGFVRNILGGKACPIGVDFGSDSVKLAQVASMSGGEWRLIAAASADVPTHVRHDVPNRMAFLVQTIRDLLTQNKFVGREAVLALPAASMFIQHLRLPKMDEESLKKALPWEARGKLPIDPSHALIRHHVAGDIYQDQEARSEVILMAAGRDLVNHFLLAAGKAKLDVVGMNVEPKAIVDCFTHVYRRKADADVTNLFVDLGCSGSRAFIARGGHLLFARCFPIGGEHFTRAVATTLNISVEEARVLRTRLASVQTTAEPPAAPRPQRRAEDQQAAAGADASFAVLGAAIAAAEKAPQPATPQVVMAAAESPEVIKAREVEQASREPLDRIVQELDLCRRYYESTFPSKPVDRIIFVGGEARHRSLCQYIAREMGMAAQVGDPLVRLARVADASSEGLDRRQPAPNWSVALGLSMGPAAVTEKMAQSA